MRARAATVLDELDMTAEGDDNPWVRATTGNGHVRTSMGNGRVGTSMGNG